VIRTIPHKRGRFTRRPRRPGFLMPWWRPNASQGRRASMDTLRSFATWAKVWPAGLQAVRFPVGDGFSAGERARPALTNSSRPV